MRLIRTMYPLSCWDIQRLAHACIRALSIIHSRHALVYVYVDAMRVTPQSLFRQWSSTRPVLLAYEKPHVHATSSPVFRKLDKVL